MFEPDGRAIVFGSRSRISADEILAHDLLGPNAFEVFHQHLLDLVSDIAIKITDCMESGDRIAALCVHAVGKNWRSH